MKVAFDSFWTRSGLNEYQEREGGFANWTKVTTGAKPSKGEVQHLREKANAWIQENERVYNSESADHLTKALFASFKKNLYSMFEADSKAANEEVTLRQYQKELSEKNIAQQEV